MQSSLKPRLERHRIFHSCCLDETHAFLQSKEFRLDKFPKRTRRFDARINGVYFPGMYVGYIQYGVPVEICAVQRDDYWLQLPISGQLEVVSGSNRVMCGAGRAAVASPTRSDYYRIRSGEGCGGIRLALFGSALLGQLTALLGEPPRMPLEFSPEIDVMQKHGQAIARHVQAAVDDLEDSGSLLASPLVMNAFQQFVMTALLMSHPHNYADALARPETLVTPRYVRRAIDYIEAHLDMAITVADLVNATGASGRTLFTHFREFRGISPMRYLRKARFERARLMLQAAEPEESVTQIAMSLGFGHLGRFSIEYRRRFGESPSETLRRQRKVGA